MQCSRKWWMQTTGKTVLLSIKPKLTLFTKFETKTLILRVLNRPLPCCLRCSCAQPNLIPHSSVSALPEPETPSAPLPTSLPRAPKIHRPSPLPSRQKQRQRRHHPSLRLLLVDGSLPPPALRHPRIRRPLRFIIPISMIKLHRPANRESHMNLRLRL